MSNGTRSYVDYSAFGETDAQGRLVKFYDHDAVTNALLQWVGSSRGDYVGFPERGGYVVRHLVKPVNDSNAQTIRESIEEGLQEEFTPRITIRTLRVTPRYRDEKYDLLLIGYAAAIRSRVKLETRLNRIGV